MVWCVRRFVVLRGSAPTGTIRLHCMAQHTHVSRTGTLVQGQRLIQTSLLPRNRSRKAEAPV